MRFRERLHVPAVWWLFAGLFTLTLLLAVGLYVGPVWGTAVTVAGLAVATAIFVRGAVAIVVDETGLRVGRAWIDHRYIGSVRALDTEEAGRRAGPEADARAHLVLRPYVGPAVEITLDDPDDPVPYWLVSTRRPDALAGALAPTSARPGPDPAR